VKALGLRVAACVLAGTTLRPQTVEAQVTAKQGSPDPTDFEGSMVLEAPFPPAIPGNKVGDWYTTADFTRMRLYRCDRIYIALFQFKVDPTTRDGLVPITLRIWLANPEGNHDKSVQVVLQAYNGDEKIAEASRVVKDEESDLAKRDIQFPMKTTDLKSTPPTKLRITIRTKDI